MEQPVGYAAAFEEPDYYGAAGDTARALGRGGQDLVAELERAGRITPEAANALRTGVSDVQALAEAAAPAPVPAPTPAPTRSSRTTPMTWGQALTTFVVASVAGFGAGSGVRWALRRR